MERERSVLRMMIQPAMVRRMALPAVLACVMIAWLPACSSAPAVKCYARPETDFSKYRKIAVYPFESLTNDEFAGERIRRLVITELLARGVEVIEPGEVANVLRTTLASKPLWSITREDVRRTGKELGVDGVMMGAVEAYRTSPGLTVPYPEVSVSLRLLDVSSADIVWSITHTSGGARFWTRHFGVEGRTLSEAARAVVKEAVATMP